MKMRTDTQGGYIAFEIESFEDREKLTSILARNGYRVWEEKNKGKYVWCDKYEVRVAM